jgi:hypothetical protein
MERDEPDWGMTGATRWLAVSFLLLYGFVTPWAKALAATVMESEEADSCLKVKVYADLAAEDRQAVIAAVARRTRLRIVKIGRAPGQVCEKHQVCEKLPAGALEVDVLKKGKCVDGYVIGEGETYWVKRRGARWRVVKRIQDVWFAVVSMAPPNPALNPTGLRPAG